MDFVIDFVMRTIGYFILSYFVYQITGRRHKYINIMFLVFLAIEAFQVFQVLFQDLNFALLLFTLRLLPLLVSWYFFLRFTNGFHMGMKFKRSKLKGIKHEIITSKRAKMGSIYMMIGAVPLFLVGYFFMEEIMVYVMYACSLLSLVGGVYIFLLQKKIKSEEVIVFIGRDKALKYRYDIPKDSYKVLPTDFFRNDDYIIDPIGQVVLVNEDQTMEIHYLYWVATSAQVDLKDSPLEEIKTIPYQDDISDFEKYHYKKTTYQYLKTGAVEKVKEKLVK
jgi:hypothetical protein